MRTKQYPPLPSDQRVSIVLPTRGDLQLRVLLPNIFLQQFFVHCRSDLQHLYRHFVVLRRFVVMSRTGDLYTQTLQTTLTIANLPRHSLLPMPRTSAYDVVKVLDLVQCCAVGQHVTWELVRVRWRNSLETWVPIGFMHENPSLDALLQEFYVNCVNSWGFYNRIQPHSYAHYRTEVELWLHHEEFQPFYQLLRTQRMQNGTQQAASAQSSPSNGHGNGLLASEPRIKQQPQEVVRARPSPVAPLDPPATTTRQPSTPTSPTRRTASASPPQSQTRSSRSRSQQQPASTSEPEVEQRIRQRLQRLRATGGGDDIVDLTDSPPKKKSHRRKRLVRPDDDDDDDDDDELEKLLSQSQSAAPERAKNKDDSSSSSTLTHSSSKEKKKKKKKKKKDKDKDTALEHEDGQGHRPRHDPNKRKSSKHHRVIINDESSGDEEDDHVDAAAALGGAPALNGEIRCVCGTTGVGTYAGRWVQCWNMDCGVWEHAECVGFVDVNAGAMLTYRCSQCDADAYRQRCAAAQKSLVDWMFRCCESKNSKQLLRLLEANKDDPQAARGWRSFAQGVRTLLMKATECGLTNCVKTLVKTYRMNPFATDPSSRNALHYGAAAGSIRCVEFLIKREPKLLRHQDLDGQTPFQWMLKSRRVNKLCLDLLKSDPTLAVAGDLVSTTPLHFACQAVNATAVKICRHIVEAHPSQVLEGTTNLESWLTLLCKNFPVDGTSEDAECARQIMEMLFDIDVLGVTLNAEDACGWRPIHYAAKNGNVHLIRVLSAFEDLDLGAPTAESKQTAVHIAARFNHAQCLRVLLMGGVSATQQDRAGRTAMVFTTSPECILELLHYRVDLQLAHMNSMHENFHTRDKAIAWCRQVILSPDLFDTINRWFVRRIEELDMVESLMLSSSHMLRADLKRQYIKYRLTTIQKARAGVERTTVPSFVIPKHECCWKKFVDWAKELTGEDFRSPLFFEWEDAACDSQNGLMTMVALRFTRKLSGSSTGLFRARPDDRTLEPSCDSTDDIRDRLRACFVLGQFLAHLVLFEVYLGGIIEFSSPFLRCALQDEKSGVVLFDASAAAFAAGFDDVLPGLLTLLNEHDFRLMLCNWQFDTDTIDWSSVLRFEGFPEDSEMPAWWLRLVAHDLVKEEKQSLALFLGGTVRATRQRLLATKSSTQSTIEPYTLRKWRPRLDGNEEDGDPDAGEDDEVDDGRNYDDVIPCMERSSDTLYMPAYSSYGALRKALLIALRQHAGAFLPR
ncbi:TPA: hypothetical protein N0F65_006108 [Lagenidium giganteum]|uniref:HECT domain-containing protein n=1 Tax=Lagenidium giganteum TaxID=4803 RepID=A0AAV2Z1R1_9STRA|nr:TPA: hypothetical protein N0F65_006108 [Lagenidium giganteum]